VSNTPLRNQYPTAGARHDGTQASKTCKISDLVGQMNRESRERTLQQIISDSQQREKRPEQQVTALIRLVDSKIAEEDHHVGFRSN